MPPLRHVISSRELLDDEYNTVRATVWSDDSVDLASIDRNGIVLATLALSAAQFDALVLLAG